MWWNLDKVIVNENKALPINWKSYSPSGRIFVEIGFGNGEFLGYLARRYPDVLIVGVEVSQLCVTKGARLALSKGLDNIRVMHGDARFLLRHCFEPETVERVYMNFPCPWPKSRHAARRVTVPVFVDMLNYLLKPSGFFQLATDVPWYAEEASQVISENSAFDVEPIVINPERPYVTKYERKWKMMGKDTCLLTIHKKSNFLLKSNGDDSWAMEVNTESKRTVEEVLEQLSGAEGDGVGGQGHWIFRDAFISTSKVGLLLVITSDEGFEQHFYFKVIPSKKGVTIKVDSVGHPYRTPAMRAALLHALDVAAS